MIFSTKPTKIQTIAGLCYLLFQQTVLPLLLNLLNRLLPMPLSAGELNFIYFFINFTAVTLIFASFLIQSIRDTLRLPGATLWYALLGFFGNRALGGVLLTLLLMLYPRFANINDLSVALSLQENFPLMAVGVVILAPVAEETLFRGLIFRGLYDRSPAAAYLVSMVAFAAAHMIGYVGSADPMLILLSLLQYLPAGYCLCFAYRHSSTIVSPILMHMAVNAVAVFTMR